MLAAMLLDTIRFAHALKICPTAIPSFSVRNVVGVLIILVQVVYHNLHINKIILINNAFN